MDTRWKNHLSERDIKVFERIGGLLNRRFGYTDDDEATSFFIYLLNKIVILYKLGKQMRFWVIHNIPSPYRLHLFSKLQQQLQRRGVNFHVHFMARGRKEREHWQKEDANIDFPASYWNDFGPRRGGLRYHFNPGLLRQLRRSRPEYLLLGGIWTSATCSLAAILHPCKSAIGWYEATPTNPGRTIGPMMRWKRFLLQRLDALAVPGENGKKHSLLLTNHNNLKRVILPNIVDEQIFVGESGFSPSELEDKKLSLGVPPSERVAFWPARHCWEKGIVEFLSLLRPDFLKGWRLVIVGDGPLRTDVEQVIRERRLENHVILKNSVSYAEMPKLYAASDLFLLPSIQDRNPLSLVEALHSGLPALVSRRAGNFPEALDEGVNGWAYDPGAPCESLENIKKAFSSSKETLRAMGEKSRERAKTYWSSEKSLEQFVDAIL